MADAKSSKPPFVIVSFLLDFCVLLVSCAISFFIVPIFKATDNVEIYIHRQLHMINGVRSSVSLYSGSNLWFQRSFS